MSTALNPSDDPEGLGLTPEELAAFDKDPEPPADVEPVASDPAPEAPPVAAAPSPTQDSASEVAAPPASGTPAQASPPATTPPAGTESPPVETPLTFRVDGKTVAPAGATVRPDGAVLIPKDAWQSLHRDHLADRGAWRDREAAYRTRIQELSQSGAETRSVHEQKAEALVKGFQRIAGLDDESYLTEALKLRAQLPVLIANAEREFYKQQAERAHHRLAPLDQVQQQALAEPLLREELAEGLRQVTDLPQYAVLKGSEDALLDRLWAIGQQQGAIGPDATGRFIYDQRVYWALLGAEVEKVEAVNAERARRAQAAVIEQRNQAALAPGHAPPPAVPVNTPAPAAASQSKRPQTREEWLERMYAEANTPD